MKQLLLILALSIAINAQEAHYVGDKSCVECHSKETHEWLGSHHDEAMMVADEKSVKGDFNDSSFSYNGITSLFYRKDGKYMVRTDGEDGKLGDFEIAYTFGVYPLQQYMVKFPKGRIQVLDIAWDSRSRDEGGQRWYHLHPDDNVTAGDPLHWTGPNLNWNYMCADCHSTNLKKNYNPQTKEYSTSWDVINVSCEACHGPASNHIAWTKEKNATLSNSGFMVSLLHNGRKWEIDPKTLKPVLHDTNKTSRYSEIEMCAKCHSRRTQLDDKFKTGDKFHNHYLPTLLDENLYYSDGKIKDEVYVYNSFLQSKMHEAGVICTDCHNPHTLERKAEGDQICFRCHKMDKYKAPSHHKHLEGSTGASCISCHMPARTYMGVDSRNDHSFRVPRPDLSVGNDTPDACTLCHKDKDASWASDAMKKWYGKIPKGKQDFAHSFEALRKNSADAPQTLYSVLMSDAPNIAKATVTTYLGNYPSKQTYTTTLQMLRNKDASIRRSALQALEAFPPQMRVKETFKLLNDPLKTVRMEATRQLSSFPLGQLDTQNRELLKKALKEYEEVLIFSADRPESQLSLALLNTSKGKFDRAEEAYREALRLQTKFVPAYINYSNFLRNQKREAEAYKVLQEGIIQIPSAGILYHSLGLWYIRNQEKEKAYNSLKRAVELEPYNSRFVYVYAVAIGEGNPIKAIELLEKSYRLHTGDLQTISGLAYYYQQIDKREKSLEYKRKLQELEAFRVQ